MAIPLLLAIPLLALLALVVLALARNATSPVHSTEYAEYMRSPAWRARARKCLEFSHRRCCLFPWLGATNAHHLHYAHLRSERTVRDIVPLSKAGHRVAHAWVFWKGPLRPLLVVLMKTSTLAIALAVRPWIALPMAMLTVGLGWMAWQQADRYLQDFLAMVRPLM